MKGKVEVFLELEEVAEIEKQAKEKDISRSAWIREAATMKLDIDAAKHEFDVESIIAKLQEIEFCYISIKELIEMTREVSGVVRVP